MCGICGIVGLEDKTLIKSMCDILSHRGPDDFGFYSDKDITLGHRRLSIIDLKKGKQPIFNEDKNIVIVYNGEIYNFKNIRKDLEEKGHHFCTDTDTEVIVHAYEEYGYDCLNLFNGMFAFAIWDSKKKILFLARDRAGIKPLYYSVFDGKIIFASEIKAILLHDEISREIDCTSFYNYLTFRYIPNQDTLFKEIKKLPAGHYLLYSLGENSKHKIVRKYWDLELKGEKSNANNYSHRIHKLLRESVLRMLISDVPLGAFLSGGVDSTYIVALMKELCEEPVKTFSVGFEIGEGYDESKFSRLAAQTYGTDHHEIFVKEKSFDLLPKILWHMDEPISDFASIPTYILSEFAKKKVSVVLTGEGADELFGGYRKYRYLRMFHPYYRTMPLPIRKFFSKATNLFDGPSLYTRIGEFHSSESIAGYYLQLISFFTKAEKEKLCKNCILSDVSGRPDILIVEPFFRNGPLINSLMALDFKTWLPEDLLMKVDKTTMAHGLEARVPYLDTSMIDLSSKVPYSLKIRFGKEKYILRKSMKKIVPEVISKRKKHGFNVPVHSWLNKGLRDISGELLSRKSVEKRGFFDYRYIEKIFGNYKKSKIYYSRQLWLLINLEIWARIYLDRDNLRNENLTFDSIIGG